MISTIRYCFQQMITFCVSIFGFLGLRISAAPMVPQGSDAEHPFVIEDPDASMRDDAPVVPEDLDRFVRILRGPFGYIPSGTVGTIREAIRRFNWAAQDMVKDVLRNARKYRIKVGPSRFGQGTFYRGKGVLPAGVGIAVYIGNLVTTRFAEQSGSKYVFSFLRMYGISFSIDGDRSEFDGNGSFINHSCVPNCHAIAELVADFGEYELHQIVIKTNRPIKPNEELTIDYNDGATDKNLAFWRDISHFKHAPAWAFTKCACQVGADGVAFCPKNRAYWNHMTKEENARCAKERRENRGKALRKANLAAKRAAQREGSSESPPHKRAKPMSPPPASSKRGLSQPPEASAAKRRRQ